MTWMSAVPALAVLGLSLPTLAQPAAAAKRPPATASTSAPVSAPPPACPPGAYCEEAELAPPPPPALPAPAPAPVEPPDDNGGTTVVIPPPSPGSDPHQPRVFVYQPGTDGGPGQVVIYEEGAEPPYYPGMRSERQPPRRKKRRRRRRNRRWGLNLRVDGVLLPQHHSEDSAGMGGLGLSLRYRPIRHFALGVSADFVAGTDSNGYARQEVPLALNALFYANPRNMAQFYIFGGVNWSFASVLADEEQAHLSEGDRDNYTYFGGHLGLGIEFRLTHLIGLNLDGLGFVRTRTDDDQDGRYPEFHNPRTNEGSNSSAGGILRAGVSFWW